MKVAVIGAGSWGTALANVLASNDNEVCMWARKPEVAEAITNEHRNPRYLSDAVLDPAITATAKLEEALAGAGAVVVVTPSRLLRDFAERMKGVVSAETPIIICSKGVEQETMLLPIEIYADVLGNEDRLAVLSGPNHAEEVVYRTPSGTVIASPSEQTALFFRGLFASTSFRCYVSSDYIGVELCAAFKNVIAIAVGIAYGMGMGDNTAAMLMTRGMAEMSRLVYARGGDPLTVMGLAGAGDLIATCTSQHSRNRTFGEYVAKGKTLEEYENETHMVVEGALACKTIEPLARSYGVELPITKAVRSVLWDKASIEETIMTLFDRPLTTEFWGLEHEGPSMPSERTYFVYPTPMGRITIASDGAHITQLVFGPAELEGACTPTALTNDAANQVQEYLAGKRKHFDLPLKASGTDFQKRVWSALEEIPYGQTRTYQEIACAIDAPRAMRAVGGANNKNPLPLFVPCHRVIGKNGDLVGYAAGLKIKQFLLDLEASNS